MLCDRWTLECVGLAEVEAWRKEQKAWPAVHMALGPGILVTASLGQVTVWNKRTGAVVFKEKLEEMEVTAVHVTSDGAVVVGGKGGVVVMAKEKQEDKEKEKGEWSVQCKLPTPGLEDMVRLSSSGQMVTLTTWGREGGGQAVTTVPTAEQFAEILRMEKSRRSDEELIKFRNKIIETMLKDHVDNVITDPHQRQLILKQIIKNIDAAYMMVCPIFYLQAQQAQIPSSQPQPASQQQWRQQNHHQHQLLPQLQQYPAVANNRPLHQHQQCPPPPPPQLQRQPHIPSQISPQSLQYQHRPAARMRSLPTQISMQNQYPCQSMPMTHYNYQTGQSQTMYSGFSPPANNTDCVQEVKFYI